MTHTVAPSVVLCRERNHDIPRGNDACGVLKALDRREKDLARSDRGEGHAGRTSGQRLVQRGETTPGSTPAILILSEILLFFLQGELIALAQEEGGDGCISGRLEGFLHVPFSTRSSRLRHDGLWFS